MPSTFSIPRAANSCQTLMLGKGGGVVRVKVCVTYALKFHNANKWRVFALLPWVDDVEDTRV